MSILDVADHIRFRSRVRLLAVYQALQVAGEDAATASHTERLALSGRVFQRLIPVEQLVEIVLANVALATKAQSDANGDGSSITNAEIVSQLAAVWTPVALAIAAES